MGECTSTYVYYGATHNGKGHCGFLQNFRTVNYVCELSGCAIISIGFTGAPNIVEIKHFHVTFLFFAILGSGTASTKSRGETRDGFAAYQVLKTSSCVRGGDKLTTEYIQKVGAGNIVIGHDL